MNPCKCGWYKHYECYKCGFITLKDNALCPNCKIKLSLKCKCSQSTVDSWKNKLSKPLLDRIDLKVLVSSFDDSFKKSYTYATSTVKKK